MARSSLRGLSRALRAVERVPAAMREARTETLNEWADNVQADAEQGVPRDTSDLWAALDHRVDERYGRAEVGVWDPDAVEYSIHVERGTSSMADQPYLLPAFNAHRGQVTRTYRAALRRSLGGGA